MSHTKLDSKFCDDFDRVVARVGLKVFRSEFESITAPSWKTIKEEMKKSSALFLLVGNKLVESQQQSDFLFQEKENWKYIQNWISYEVGLACQLGIDVWVTCDGMKINFPVPYLNNYEIHGIGSTGSKSFDWYGEILKGYANGGHYPLDPALTSICPYDDCKAEYNLRSVIRPNGTIICPTCLKEIMFKDGFRV